MHDRVKRSRTLSADYTELSARNLSRRARHTNAHNLGSDRNPAAATEDDDAATSIGVTPSIISTEDQLESDIPSPQAMSQDGMDDSDTSSRQRPSRQEQLKQLQEAIDSTSLRQDDGVVADPHAAHYIIPADWWAEYMDWLRTGDGSEPDDLDLESGLEHLKDDSNELRSDLVPGEDFTLLTVDEWTLIQSWYGTEGDEVIRYALKRSDGTFGLELRPTEFHLSLYDAENRAFSELRSVRMYRRKPMDDLYEKVRHRFDLGPNVQIRFWHASSGASGGGRLATLEELQTSISKTYDNSSIASQTGDETTFIIETRKSGAAKWPLDEAVPAARARGASAAGSTAISADSSNVARPSVATRARPRGTKGLVNLGNTCYMASALQCLSHVKELVEYFLSGAFKDELNDDNPLGYGGRVATAYARLLEMLYSDDTQRAVRPSELKMTLGNINQSFGGYQQQDSQELLAFLLDALHEDTNRIRKKPATERPDIGSVSDDELLRLGEEAWHIHKRRNDSVIVDLLQGVYKSTLVCPVCEHVSVTFDPFSDLSLPLPFRTFWSHELVFVPLTGKQKKLWIELEQNASIAHIVAYLSKKFDVPTDRIAGAEVWKSRFYKMYSSYMPVTVIERADVAYFYELDRPDPRSVRDSTDLLIPVYTSKPETKQSISLTAVDTPFMLVLPEDELKDYDAIQDKILQGYSRFTTSTDLNAEDLTKEQEQPQNVNNDSPEDSSEGDNDDAKSDASAEIAVNRRAARQHRLSLHTHTVPQATPLVIKVAQAKREFFSNSQTMPLRDRLVSAATRPPPRFEPIRPRQLTPPEDAPPSYNDFDSASMRGDTSRRTTPDIDMNDTSDEEGEDGRSALRIESRIEEDVGSPVAEFTPFEPTLITPSADELDDPMLGEKAIVRDPQPDVTTSTEPLLHDGDNLVCEWSHTAYDLFFSHEQETLAGKSLWEEYEIVTDAAMEARRAEREQSREKVKSLDDCLDEFAKEEPLDAANAWYCPKCKQHQQANKTFELWRAGDVLVFHLKRFSNSRSLADKIDAEIRFPVKGLDLSNRLGERKLLAARGDKDLPEAIYDLTGVVNHYGGLGGGHYTAFAQTFDDGLYHNFNDASVNNIEADTLVSSSAYLLFYRRRSSTPLGGQALQDKIQAGFAAKHQQQLSVASASTSTSNTSSSNSRFLRELSAPVLLGEERSMSAGPTGSPSSSPALSIANLPYTPANLSFDVPPPLPVRQHGFTRSLGGANPTSFSSSTTSDTPADPASAYQPPASNPFTATTTWGSALHQVPLSQPQGRLTQIDAEGRSPDHDDDDDEAHAIHVERAF